MKRVMLIIVLLLLEACLSLSSTTLVLSEPMDSASARSLTQSHRLSINEARMLIYNGEEKLYVPEDKEVIFEATKGTEPTFILRDK